MNCSSDIVICGAGPAGTTASAFLGKKEIPHILIDQAVFPRDKICGDALSGKVLPVIKKLDASLLNEMVENREHFHESHGIRFASPDGNAIDIPFRKEELQNVFPPGFLSKRYDFDHFLHKTLNHSYTDFRQGTKLLEITKIPTGLELLVASGKVKYTIQTKLLISSDGDRSVAAKKLNGFQVERNHYCAGIRAYYAGVSDLHPRNFIELHFIKSMLPGYLWIFPMSGGRANVGAGMLSSVIAKKKINLRERMLFALENEPTLKNRFKNAVIEGGIEGWGLPLGSKKRSVSGDHFLLTGDAASLIDPFTGEGISNAMITGMMAADTAAAAVEQHNFSKSFLSQYESNVYQRLLGELKISRTLQQLCKYPWLFNFVVRKASKNKTFRDTITCMFDDIDMRSRLTSPVFYFNLLFSNNGK
ncbi:MAG TPA: geranylgeranyl reductase family protein [Bacteroidia bacterium]|nr:geranylgeranyl reductase family protein [Bacteroidia bacterium]